MRGHFFLILIFTLFFSCKKTGGEKPDYVERKNVSEGDDIILVKDNDQEMDKAIENAVANLNIFESEFTNHKLKGTDFYLKQNINSEHFWCGEVFVKDNVYYGVLANDPGMEANKELHFGDTVKIEKDKISDWQFTVKDTIYGSYTTRVLRDKMTSSERDDFDKQTGNIYK